MEPSGVFDYPAKKIVSINSSDIHAPSEKKISATYALPWDIIETDDGYQFIYYYNRNIYDKNLNFIRREPIEDFNLDRIKKAGENRLSTTIASMHPIMTEFHNTIYGRYYQLIDATRIGEIDYVLYKKKFNDPFVLAHQIEKGITLILSPKDYDDYYQINLLFNKRCICNITHGFVSIISEDYSEWRKRMVDFLGQVKDLDKMATVLLNLIVSYVAYYVPPKLPEGLDAYRQI